MKILYISVTLLILQLGHSHALSDSDDDDDDSLARYYDASNEKETMILTCHLLTHNVARHQIKLCNNLDLESTCKKYDRWVPFVNPCKDFAETLCDDVASMYNPYSERYRSYFKECIAQSIDDINTDVKDLCKSVVGRLLCHRYWWLVREACEFAVGAAFCQHDLIPEASPEAS